MGLTNKEKEKIKEYLTKKLQSKWTKDEIERLKEARQLGCTPADIVKLNLIPTKTYYQIRNKILSIERKTESKQEKE